MPKTEHPFDPFAFFALPPTFALDEEALRDRYFQMCRDHRENSHLLTQAHTAYRILMDPVQRLDVLILKAELGPLPEVELPPDIIKLYEAVESLQGDASVLLRRLEDFRQSTLKIIPSALTRRDPEALAHLRACLMYIKRLIGAVYLKIYA